MRKPLADLAIHLTDGTTDDELGQLRDLLAALPGVEHVSATRSELNTGVLLVDYTDPPNMFLAVTAALGRRGYVAHSEAWQGFRVVHPAARVFQPGEHAVAQIWVERGVLPLNRQEQDQ